MSTLSDIYPKTTTTETASPLLTSKDLLKAIRTLDSNIIQQKGRVYFSTTPSSNPFASVGGINFYESEQEIKIKKEPAVLDFSDGQLRCSLCHKVNPSTQHIRSHMTK